MMYNKKVSGEFAGKSPVLSENFNQKESFP